MSGYRKSELERVSIILRQMGLAPDRLRDLAALGSTRCLENLCPDAYSSEGCAHPNCWRTMRVLANNCAICDEPMGPMSEHGDFYVVYHGRKNRLIGYAHADCAKRAQSTPK
jgi:hypothetical protein